MRVEKFDFYRVTYNGYKIDVRVFSASDYYTIYIPLKRDPNNFDKHLVPCSKYRDIESAIKATLSNNFIFKYI